MKRTIATALVAVATLTGAASAMTTDARLSVIQSYAPNADLEQLTDRQIDSLLSVIYSGDSEGEKRGYVQSITGG